MITAERALELGKVFLVKPEDVYEGPSWMEDMDKYNNSYVKVIEVTPLGGTLIVIEECQYGGWEVDLSWCYEGDPNTSNEQKEYTPKVGDYIPTSELDTEEKHNFARKKMTITVDNPVSGVYATLYLWNYLVIGKGGCYYSDHTLENRITLEDLGWVDVEVSPVSEVPTVLELSDLIEGETYKIVRPEDYKTCDNPTWNSDMGYLVDKEVSFSKMLIREDLGWVNVDSWSIHPNWLVHVPKVVCDEYVITSETDETLVSQKFSDCVIEESNGKPLEVSWGGVSVGECNIIPEQNTPHKSDGGWSDTHYDFDYSLTEEDLVKGSVRVDAYFVNRMWGINKWDDTGAAFHMLKTLTRASQGKNSIKRELTAIVKQANILAKLHGVEVE